MPKPDRNVWVLVGRYTSLAFVLPACVLVGYAIGYGLDRLFGTSFLYIVFLLIGIAAGFVELVREVQRDCRE
jgi:F0F1-type ATP synthase assembly protein I